MLGCTTHNKWNVLACGMNLFTLLKTLNCEDTLSASELCCYCRLEVTLLVETYMVLCLKILLSDTGLCYRPSVVELSRTWQHQETTI